MTTAPTTPAQPTCPDTHQDRPAPSADTTTRTGRLLGLLRTLILYGQQLAATLQQRTATTNLADITRSFGTSDIARILASITRGLLLAAALQARVASRPVRQQAVPAEATRTPSRRQPRTAPPEDRNRRRGRSADRQSPHARRHRRRRSAAAPPAPSSPISVATSASRRGPAVAGNLPGHLGKRRQHPQNVQQVHPSDLHLAA